jgi:hypothetical protein
MLQSTLEDTGIEWPALWKHIPCMADIIQLTLGAFISSLGVKVHTKSWEAYEHDQQFGENESIHNGKRQRLRKEGNARINTALGMRPALAKIIEKVGTSRYFENPETDLQIAVVLATGKGNPPAVRLETRGSVWFGLVPDPVKTPTRSVLVGLVP